MEAPARQSVATQVVSVVATVAITAFGLWVGLALVGASDQLGIGALVITAGALLVVELALRSPLRRLAAHGSALMALVIGLVAQVFTAWLVAVVILGVRIQDWLHVLVVLATMAVITAIGRWLVGASDAAYVVGHTLRRRPREQSASAPARGLVVVQLDGVSADVLRRAMASGQAPTISRWLREGTYVLREWWVPVPSTTPASQAAILHGDDSQVPGFRWWDRELDRLMVSNRPADA
ncbi:MAG: alkaline phosphatase family protein, partial [Micrococcales bacterium]|nr:alkaline phosphatase family protein [Micrococcales bacterium]